MAAREDVDQPGRIADEHGVEERVREAGQWLFYKDTMALKCPKAIFETEVPRLEGSSLARLQDEVFFHAYEVFRRARQAHVPGLKLRPIAQEIQAISVRLEWR